jgi:rhodanese-related sulfurtransferase
MEIEIMPPFRVEERRAKGEKLHLVDVRSPAEYEAVHATGAKLYPPLPSFFVPEEREPARRRRNSMLREFPIVWWWREGPRRGKRPGYRS